MAMDLPIARSVLKMDWSSIFPDSLYPMHINIQYFLWLGCIEEYWELRPKNRLISHVMVKMINWKQEPSRLLQLSVLPFSYLLAGWTMALCGYKPSQNVLTLIHFIKLRWPKLSRCEWRCWELRAATLMGWTVQQDVTHGLTGHRAGVPAYRSWVVLSLFGLAQHNKSPVVWHLLKRRKKPDLDWAVRCLEETNVGLVQDGKLHCYSQYKTSITQHSPACLSFQLKPEYQNLLLNPSLNY